VATVAQCTQANGKAKRHVSTGQWTVVGGRWSVVGGQCPCPQDLGPQDRTRGGLSGTCACAARKKLCASGCRRGFCRCCCCAALIATGDKQQQAAATPTATVVIIIWEQAGRQESEVLGPPGGLSWWCSVSGHWPTHSAAKVNKEFGTLKYNLFQF